MKIYVAGHIFDQPQCREITKCLVVAGHTITSTWLQESIETPILTDKDKQWIAQKDTTEVMESDGLVLLACDRPCPGGKFVETGIALGLGKPVWIIGRRENMLLWHPNIICKQNVEEVIQSIKETEYV